MHGTLVLKITAPHTTHEQNDKGTRDECIAEIKAMLEGGLMQESNCIYYLDGRIDIDMKGHIPAHPQYHEGDYFVKGSFTPDSVIERMKKVDDIKIASAYMTLSNGVGDMGSLKINSEPGVFKGEVCNRNGCKGILEEHEPEHGRGCTCFINPPCSFCTDDRTFCESCGYEGREAQMR